MSGTNIEIGHNNHEIFVVDDNVSLSEKGYQFQFDLVRKIIERFSGYSTVTLFDMSGTVITQNNFEKRGRDGGLDLLIRIETKTVLASKQIAGKVWKALLEI